MIGSDRSSAEALERHIPGTLMAASTGQPWKDLLVQIFARRQIQDNIIVPAVPEPLVVWILSGAAVVEERDIGGAWQAYRVKAGDFFLTNTLMPYEMRWKTSGPQPFQVMHLYLGLPVFRRAIKEVLDQDGDSPRLRDVSGAKDEILSMLLGHLFRELSERHKPSPLFAHGIAQSLAVHLVRNYTDPAAKAYEHRGGLPAFKLRRVTSLLAAHLDEEFSLQRLAREAGLSVFHFCRAFKKTTGFSPSRYFIRLRMEKARLLLRETDRSVIDVGLDVGYSSPSHFAQVFRREVGVSPSDYRGRI